MLLSGTWFTPVTSAFFFYFIFLFLQTTPSGSFLSKVLVPDTTPNAASSPNTTHKARTLSLEGSPPSSSTQASVQLRKARSVTAATGTAKIIRGYKDSHAGGRLQIPEKLATACFSP